MNKLFKVINKQYSPLYNLTLNERLSFLFDLLEVSNNYFYEIESSYLNSENPNFERKKLYIKKYLNVL